MCNLKRCFQYDLVDQMTNFSAVPKDRKSIMFEKSVSS